jgi:hypothetical protein
MNNRKKSNSWELLPATLEDVEFIRDKCRYLVLRRALASAGLSAIPIPGLDIAVDLSFLARAINDINMEFGLSPDQIQRLQPEMRLVAYEMLMGMGGVMVGKIVTRDVVAHLLKRSGLKLLVQHAAKIVPVAGQIASASIGFVTFRAIANQHVDACATAAVAMLSRQAN